MRRGVRGFHQGPGTEVPSPQAEYKCATEPACPNSSPLANAGRTIQVRASRPRWAAGQRLSMRAGSPHSQEASRKTWLNCKDGGASKWLLITYKAQPGPAASRSRGFPGSRPPGVAASWERGLPARGRPKARRGPRGQRCPRSQECGGPNLSFVRNQEVASPEKSPIFITSSRHQVSFVDRKLNITCKLNGLIDTPHLRSRQDIAIRVARSHPWCCIS